MICKRVIFRGRVQGVGFRFTAQRIAEDHEVSGYVRNLNDGTVELAAEGEPDELASFIEQVKARMADYISETQITDQSPQGFAGFHIRY